MSFLEDTHHRINQALAASGGRVVLPNEWPAIDELTEKISRYDFVRLSNFDDNPDAQDLAAQLDAHCRTSWKYAEPAPEGDILIHYGWWPDYDYTNPTQLFALTWGFWEALPLERPEDWRNVALEVQHRGPHCHLHEADDCQDTNTETFAVKRGEFIHVFVCCPPCLEAVRTGEEEEQEEDKNGGDEEDPWWN